MQNAVTVVKIGSIVALAVLGSWWRPRRWRARSLRRRLPSGNLLAAFGVAMIAVLWTYDGWYGFAFLAGEMREPERNLPLGLIAGTHGRHRPLPAH